MQPAQGDLPELIETYQGEIVRLHSVLLGIRWELICDNNNYCLQIGQCFISFLESFFATSLIKKIIPFKEKVKLRFELAKPNDVCSDELGLVLKLNAENALAEIVIWNDKISLENDGFKKIVDFFTYTMINLLPQLVVIEDMENFFKIITEEEEGFSRSVLSSNSMIANANIFGNAGRPDLKKWFDKKRKYKLLVEIPYNIQLKAEIEIEKAINAKKHEFNKVKDKEFNIDNSALKHGKQKIKSLINESLWNEAGWSGIAWFLALGYFPVLGLLFSNEKIGKQIFQEWINDFGKIDKDDQLRLCVITGIDRNFPSSYKVALGVDIDSISLARNERVITNSRINKMEDPNPINLQNFQNVFNLTKSFGIAPVTFEDDFKNPKFHFDYTIQKSKIFFKEAWTIGRHDIDSVAINLDTNPIIPENIKNAPIEELENYLKSKIK